MRILPDFKIPNLKFKKIKMKDVENIEELKNNTTTKEKNKTYIKTNYKTIKEIFNRSKEKFANEVFIAQKFNPKGQFIEKNSINLN